jgi:NitT/TauT family transport system ATP-binding protein
MISIDVQNAGYEDKIVLKDFSCEILEGQLNVLIGKSGVGKTTLLNIILGLNSSYKGNIKGLENKKISAVFQEDRLMEDMSVYKNLMLVNKDRELMEKAIAGMGMDNILNVRVNKLSGGMKRRIALVRALIGEFDILVLDEPFVGIDKETLKKVIEYIKSAARGKTIIMASHDENLYEYFSEYNIIKVKENNCG